MILRLPVLILILPLLSSCVASSAHVKRGDELTLEIASELERHEKIDHQQPAVMASYVRQKAQEHAQENATILGDIPANSIPWETLGGFGTLIGAGFALWQRSGKLHAVSVAKEVAELEPERAKEVLKRKNIA